VIERHLGHQVPQHWLYLEGAPRRPAARYGSSPARLGRRAPAPWRSAARTTRPWRSGSPER